MNTIGLRDCYVHLILDFTQKLIYIQNRLYPALLLFILLFIFVGPRYILCVYIKKFRKRIFESSNLIYFEDDDFSHRVGNTILTQCPHVSATRESGPLLPSRVRRPTDLFSGDCRSE